MLSQPATFHYYFSNNVHILECMATAAATSPGKATKGSAMDDMRNLAAFVRVAHTGTFTGAAADLGLTTAAVS